MKVSYKSISRIGIIGCLIYVMWYKWVYGEIALVLYSTAAIAIMGMMLGLLSSGEAPALIFPYGCVRDLLMCIYSVLTGVFVAKSRSILESTIVTYLAFALLCLAFCYASYENGFDWLLKGFIVIAILCTIWTLTNGYYINGYGKVLSPTNNPHTLSFVMVLGIFALAYLSKTSINNFSVNLFIGMLFLYMIIQCGSRKGLIAALFIVIPWILIEIKTIMEYGSFTQKILIFAILLFIVGGITYYYSHVYVNTTSFERMANIEESQANQSRMGYFELGKEFFFQSPIIGIGLGQFAVLNPNGAYSHSTLPEAIASWGFVGSLLYFIPILITCWRMIFLVRVTPNKENVLILALCAMEIFMSFVQIYFYSLQHMMVWAVIFWFVKSKYNGKVYYCEKR